MVGKCIAIFTNEIPLTNKLTMNVNVVELNLLIHRNVLQLRQANITCFKKKFAAPGEYCNKIWGTYKISIQPS